jgi:hypothetical protein
MPPPQFRSAAKLEFLPSVSSAGHKRQMNAVRIPLQLPEESTE